MKKLILSTLALVCLLLILVSADFRTIPYLETRAKEAPPRSCLGYTIIEYDKAVTCNGDTVQLTRRHGYAEPVGN